MCWDMNQPISSGRLRLPGNTPASGPAWGWFLSLYSFNSAICFGVRIILRYPFFVLGGVALPSKTDCVITIVLRSQMTFRHCSRHVPS